MKVQTRRGWLRTIIGAIYLALSCFLVAHTINAGIAHRLVSGSPGVAAIRGPVPTPALPPADDTSAPSLETLKQEILSRGLFPIPPVSNAGGDGIQAQGQPPPPPLNLAKKLKLGGTVIGEGSHSFAILEELPGKRQLLYHLGDQIPDAGQLVEVHRSGVLIRQGPQEEFLPVRVTDGPEPQPATFFPQPPQTAVPDSKRRILLDRREVEAAVSNMNKLLAEARATPFFREGKVAGYEIVGLNPDSFYNRIGLIPGDVVIGVNGVEVRDPGQVFTLFQRMKDERSVKVDLLRRGSTPTTLTYEIR